MQFGRNLGFEFSIEGLWKSNQVKNPVSRGVMKFLPSTCKVFLSLIRPME